MNVKHTPGPWRLGAENAADGYNIHAGKSDYVGHTCGYAPRPGSKHRELPPEEAQANAHLIAAAPDLLAALKKAVAWLEHNSEHADFHTKTHEAIVQARHAIAKATFTEIPQ